MSSDPLRYFRRQVRRAILVGVVALLLSGLMAYVVDSKSDEWWRSADRVSGTVVAITNRTRFPERRRTTVEVTFTHQGVARRETLQVVSDPDYEIGSEILVYVDRDNPEKVWVPHASYLFHPMEDLLIGVPAIGGLVVLALGFGLQRQIRSQEKQEARLAALRPPPPNR